MRADKARLILFITWMCLLIFYYVLLLLTHKINGIAFEKSSDAAFKMLFVILPIVSAFGCFWFQTQRRERGPAPDDCEPIPTTKCVAMFAITGGVNLIVVLYFFFGILLVDFDHPDILAESFVTRVEDGVKLFVFLSSFVALPVGFLLGEEVPAKKPTAKSK